MIETPENKGGEWTAVAPSQGPYNFVPTKLMRGSSLLEAFRIEDFVGLGEEAQLEADFWASFAKPTKPSMRNDPSRDDHSINVVEHCAQRPTATPMSAAHDRLFTEYAAAKTRLSSPQAADSDW